MLCYFAPMEGLTDSVYRRLHHTFFPGVDRYYMPFYSPTAHRRLSPKEARELPKADSVDFFAVPQILTKHPEDFLWAAGVCRDLGYGEVNLNLGCPSGTVVAKGKGSGMLRDVDALDAFLEGIFRSSPLPISVKTRLGLEAPEEFPRLLEVYNRYPIRELTIHPRVRSQLYSGSVDKEMFAWALAGSRSPVCYNGDLTTLAQIREVEKTYPQLKGVMIGRGLIGNPGLLGGGTDVDTLERFLEALLEAYEADFGGSRNAMFRMKEHWSYLRLHLPGSDKLWKRLRKTTDVAEFREITRLMLHTLPFV